MGMISVCFGLFCGSIGVLICFWFTRAIYGALKVD
jgi:transmembrane 9 superfamily member 2/4